MQSLEAPLQVVNMAWFKYTRKDLNSNLSLNQIALMVYTIAATVTSGVS
jgi:hypothetical protein